MLWVGYRCIAHCSSFQNHETSLAELAMSRSAITAFFLGNVGEYDHTILVWRYWDGKCQMEFQVPEPYVQKRSMRVQSLQQTKLGCARLQKEHLEIITAPLSLYICLRQAVTLQLCCCLAIACWAHQKGVLTYPIISLACNAFKYSYIVYLRLHRGERIVDYINHILLRLPTGFQKLPLHELDSPPGKAVKGCPQRQVTPTLNVQKLSASRRFCML